MSGIFYSSTGVSTFPCDPRVLILALRSTLCSLLSLSGGERRVCWWIVLFFIHNGAPSLALCPADPVFSLGKKKPSVSAFVEKTFQGLFISLFRRLDSSGGIIRTKPDSSCGCCSAWSLTNTLPLPYFFLFFLAE